MGEHEKMRRLSLALSPYRYYMEEDENFRKWVEALERGSITTASNYFRKNGLRLRAAGYDTPGGRQDGHTKLAKFPSTT